VALTTIYNRGKRQISLAIEPWAQVQKIPTMDQVSIRYNDPAEIDFAVFDGEGEGEGEGEGGDLRVTIGIKSEEVSLICNGVERVISF
jgi:hypothetical protein